MLACLLLLAAALVLLKAAPGRTASTPLATLPLQGGFTIPVPNLEFEQPTSGDLTAQQTYAASVRVVYDDKGDTRLPLATLWVAQTRTAAIALAELAASGGQYGGPMLAVVVLELLPDTRTAASGSSGTMSWHGWPDVLLLGESCPDSHASVCREEGTGPEIAPIYWSNEWVTRDGIWSMAVRFIAPLAGLPAGGTLGGVVFAVATRTNDGKPLVVVSNADQATVDAWADDPPSGQA